MSSEDIPALERIDSDDSYDSGSDDEENFETEPTKCLFCEEILKSVDLAIGHVESAHSFKLGAFKTKFSMDQYSFIKLINFIRINKTSAEELLKLTKPEWTDEKYLKPVEYEPWLSYDFDEIHTETPSNLTNGSTSVSLTLEKYQTMEKLVASLMEKIKEKDILLDQAVEDIDKMRKSFRHFMEKDTKSDDDKQLNCVAGVSLKADEGYFNSYAHFGIHHDMLSDWVRTLSYRDSLLENKEFISGKTVLDLGCGTSVLSMFASQAGAKDVVGVDNSDIIHNAMDIVKKNNFTNIALVKGRLEDTPLPVEKFDIIISEWMGYFLFFEGMLDSVIYARDKHLKPGGMLMPNRCNISLVGYGDEEIHNKYVTFWDSVCGLDMTTLKKPTLHEPLIEVCKSDRVLTDVNIIAEYDLMTVDLNYSNFSFDFKLKCLKAGKLTSFLGYFDIFFDLPNKVEFSTSPAHKPTHWRQVVFLMEHPVDVTEGQVITGNFVCSRSRSSVRSLDIKIKAFGKSFSYFLD